MSPVHFGALWRGCFRRPRLLPVSSFDVNRFYPKTQLSWLARLDHSHCNSADPLTDGLEVCCVFYGPGPGGCYALDSAYLHARGNVLRVIAPCGDRCEMAVSVPVLSLFTVTLLTRLQLCMFGQ